MGIISWLIMGALAGWIASMFMGTNAQMGTIANIVSGIVGGMIGGALWEFFGGTGINGFSIHSLIVSTVGAAIFIYLVKLIKR